MNIYNLEFVGKFVVEFIYNHTVWTIDDVGSIIYDVKRHQYFVGGYDDWILFNLEPGVIKSNHIDFGYFDNQVSSKTIPSEYDIEYKTLQESIDLAISNVETVDYDYGILTRELFDITASGFNSLDGTSLVENKLICRIRDDVDGLILNDSTSFVNPMLVQDALCILELDTTSHTSLTITSFDTTSFVQDSLDSLNWNDPPTPNLNQLYDYGDDISCDSTSIVELYLKTTGSDYGLHCMKSTDLVLNVSGPSVIPTEHLTFQDLVSSCGGDFKQCQPYVISNVLLFDDLEDYDMLINYYTMNHTQLDPDIMYDFINMQVLEFYNGNWITTIDHTISELTDNTIYIIPITNTIFFIDCNSIYSKIFDRKRYGL